MGNEGDDWLEQGNLDGARATTSTRSGHDRIIGNDVFLGSGVPDIMNGEGGDDIMVGSGGSGRQVPRRVRLRLGHVQGRHASA